jgi:zinc protease
MLSKKISCFLILTLAVFTALPAYAMNIQEVTSKNGIKAWLVEDKKLPLIAMHFAFRGGTEQDPIDKQGLATLTTELLTEGAGPYDAAAFQQELADHSIGISFEAGRDALLGDVKMLKTDQDKAIELLQLALTKARFDTAAIERLRARQMSALRLQYGNPGWQARVALFRQIFGTHPYGERRLGTSETLARLTAADIRNFAARHLARDNLVIAVAGDMTPGELSGLLDRVFGDLPKKARLAEIPEIVWPQNTASILVPREGTQTELLFAMPGPKRDDPDWYAAEIADYILGSGGFSSRLMQDVRDKNGLTYGIETGLSPMEHGGILIGSAATDNSKTGKAWSIALDTMRRFYDDGVTEKEITAAKDYLTGSLPLTMTSTDKIAAALVTIQLDHLGRDYIDRYNDLVRNVTEDEVEQATKRWFNPDRLTLVMVGKPEGVTPSQTQEPVRK